ncbi:MAG: glycoside hydrolase family 15 protein [Acidimicrobiia bacterium]
MPSRIEQYALIGDTQTAALVANDGCIDWLCVPRFDSEACFASLLGTPDNGHWRIWPANGDVATRRSYREGTLVLETEWDTPEGSVRIVDCMPIRDQTIDVVRLVEGLRGRVPMRMELIARFDYGHVVPWVRSGNGNELMVAGPNGLSLTTPVQTHGENLTTVADFTVPEGHTVPFVLSWFPSHARPPRATDALKAVERTTGYWKRWSARMKYRGAWAEMVNRSAITLKALTYAPTGGIVAAPTCSLPEWIGGARNWDYRFCWLRDATLTLTALMGAGYVEEAKAWREWLLRAVAGDPAKLQIMYGPAGERRLTEYEVPWLSGYENSVPVRVGNAASEQFQLDVYGEVLNTLYGARAVGLQPDANVWEIERALLGFVEDAWRKPDDGIWEVRGGQQHFTHSKVMAWVAFDRAARSVEEFGLDGSANDWRKIADEIKAEVLAKGYDEEKRAFVQHYGSTELDASLLMIPLVGFLPATDPRMRGTIDAIRKELTADGFTLRYRTESAVDGLPAGEGVFLPCTFWMADSLYLLGQHHEARALFERLLSLANDVGLLAEEYDPKARRQLGNFPQAFTHVALMNTAMRLSGDRTAHGDVISGATGESAS